MSKYRRRTGAMAVLSIVMPADPVAEPKMLVSAGVTLHRAFFETRAKRLVKFVKILRSELDTNVKLAPGVMRRYVSSFFRHVGEWRDGGRVW
jgi:hypothetical protein